MLSGTFQTLARICLSPGTQKRQHEPSPTQVLDLGKAARFCSSQIIAASRDHLGFFLWRSEEFTQYLSVSSTQQLHNIDALDAHRDRQQRTLKRNLSSGVSQQPSGRATLSCAAQSQHEHAICDPRSNLALLL